MHDYFDLKGQVAIVTGASRGIGKAIALSLARAGARVVGCARNTSLLNDLVAEIGRLGGDAVGLKVDLKNYDEVQSMADAAIDQFGKVDILVNNAGVVLLKPLVESSEDEWRNVIDTNLVGCFYCCKAIGKHMIERKSGKVINMSSMRGFVGAINERT